MRRSDSGNAQQALWPTRPLPAGDGASGPAMATIERKSLLYRSGLGFWCINHVQGCTHGCRYPCHAYMLARRRGRVRDLVEWRRPLLVGNALELLDRELRRRRRPIERVQLSLTTDPFMVGEPEVTALTLALVERINEAGVDCSLLTKGLLPSELADGRRFRRSNTYGISLVSLDEPFRERWEPGAARYADRIAAARALHERGCRTRAHIEPYPTPNVIVQDLHRLLEQVPFVDRLFFGGWNYYRAATAFPGRDRFYAEQARLVRAFCTEHGIDCES